MKIFTAVFIVLGFASAAYPRDFFCPSGDVTCLIAAIKKANATGQPDTIKLEAGVYSLTTAAETNDDGANGLPSITTEIKIVGKDPTSTVIERDPTLPRFGFEFRIIHVGAAGNLTLDGVTIKGGFGFDMFLDGPAVFNRGTTKSAMSLLQII